MYATDYFEKIILDLARGISATAPAQMYLALFLNNPTDAGTGTEVSYAGYARVPITFSTPAPMGSGIGMTNTETLTFATAQTSVGNVTYVGVMDSLAGGNMWLYGQMGDVLNISANIAPVVRPSSVKWMLTGKMSAAYKAKVFNLLRGVNCPGFTPYLALCNGSPEDGGAEFAGNAYARTQMAFGSPAPQSGGAMMISNSTQVETPIATGTWGMLTHIAVYDADTGGEPYLIDEASTSVLMNTGKAVIYNAGAFNFSIN